jgi:hypothetical protein
LDPLTFGKVIPAPASHHDWQISHYPKTIKNRNLSVFGEAEHTQIAIFFWIFWIGSRVEAGITRPKNLPSKYTMLEGEWQTL